MTIYPCLYSRIQFTSEIKETKMIGNSDHSGRGFTLNVWICIKAFDVVTKMNGNFRWYFLYCKSSRNEPPVAPLHLVDNSKKDAEHGEKIIH